MLKALYRYLMDYLEEDRLTRSSPTPSLQRAFTRAHLSSITSTPKIVLYPGINIEAYQAPDVAQGQYSHPEWPRQTHRDEDEDDDDGMSPLLLLLRSHVNDDDVLPPPPPPPRLHVNDDATTARPLR
ncbi:hypothetical protein EV363DRAFT_1447331 [Boletus edulis]|nr:hypothetical protein EV363DRAFT_1447331 [Boletus edulis]